MKEKRKNVFYVILVLLLIYFDLSFNMRITFNFSSDICELKNFNEDIRSHVVSSESDKNSLHPHYRRTSMAITNMCNDSTKVCISFVISNIEIYPIKFENFLALEKCLELDVSMSLEPVKYPDFLIFHRLMLSYHIFTEKISPKTFLNILYIFELLKPLKCPIFYKIINVLLLNFDSDFSSHENPDYLTKELSDVLMNRISYNNFRILLNQFIYLYIFDCKNLATFLFDMLSDLSPMDYDLICDGTNKRILSLDTRFLLYFKEDIYSYENRLQLFNTLVLLFRVQTILIISLDDSNLHDFKIFFELLLNDIESIIFKNIQITASIESFILLLLNRIKVKQIYFIDALLDNANTNTKGNFQLSQKITFINFIDREICEDLTNQPPLFLEKIQCYMIENFKNNSIKRRSSSENLSPNTNYYLANNNKPPAIAESVLPKENMKVYSFFKCFSQSWEIHGYFSNSNSLKNIKIIFNDLEILMLQKTEKLFLENLTSMQIRECNLSPDALIYILNLPNIKHLEIKDSKILKNKNMLVYSTENTSLNSLKIVNLEICCDLSIYKIIFSLKSLKDLHLKFSNRLINTSSDLYRCEKTINLKTLYFSSDIITSNDKYFCPKFKVEEKITFKNIVLTSLYTKNTKRFINARSVTFHFCELNNTDENSIKLTNVQTLAINACRFKNIMLHQIFIQTHFYSIETLELTKVQINQSDIHFFSSFTNLQYLFIYDCEFIDHALMSFKYEKYDYLRLFHLKFNKIKTCLDCICHLEDGFPKNILLLSDGEVR